MADEQEKVSNARQPRDTAGRDGDKRKPRDNKFAISQAEREVEKAEEELEREKENYGPDSQRVKDAQKKIDEAKEELKDLQTGKPSKRREKQDEFLQDYYDELGPWVSQLMQEDPELRKLIRDAISESWDADTFDMKLRRTEWWGDTKKTNAWLNAFKSEFGDGPGGQWQDSLTKASQAVDRRARKLFGVTLDEETLARIARRSIYQGWGEIELDSWLSSRMERDRRDDEYTPGGDFLSEKEALRATARDYGLIYNDDWLNREASKILNPAEAREREDVVNEMVETARSRWSVFGDRINANYSVRDAASSYITQASQWLEVDANQLELDDTLFEKAFNSSDEEGNPKLMSLWDFQKAVREDPRWQSTENARTTYTQVGENMLKMFGFRG